MFIDNTNTDSPLIYGEFDSNLVRINGTLDINNAYVIPNITGSANQVLSTNGIDSAKWVAKGVFDENIQLNGHYLSNDGTDEGLLIDNNGNLSTSGDMVVGGNATINSQLKIGSTSSISGIIKYSETRNVGSISGNSSRIETFSIAGSKVGDVVHVSTNGQLQSQIVIAQVWVSSTNTVSVRFRNTDGGSQNPDGNGLNYSFVLIQ